jgi:2-dehydro-3-deoxy-D-arabinonate dehydratase
MTQILRYFDPEKGERLGCLSKGRVVDLTERFGSLAAWLGASVGSVEAAIQELAAWVSRAEPRYSFAELDHAPEDRSPHLLAAIDRQEVWAAGVTYRRSREARQQEALNGGDIYARVYAAERPELFFKALGEKVVGHRAAVGIRADAAWSVPEPELALVLNPGLEVVGMTIGNDMSSRDLEGANPLYLPQAKVYTASCALGPVISLQPLAEWPRLQIGVKIERGGREVFSGETDTSSLHRSLSDLVAYLGRSSQFPYGAVLLTGTGIVPPGEFTLQAGDQVSIQIEQIGELVNVVQVV